MKIIALFNLKPGVSIEAYEAWARGQDMPVVRALPSIAGFEVLGVTGQLGETAAPPPYQYVEIIDVADQAGFADDVSTPAMQKIAGEFAALADVTFLTTRAV